MTTTFMLSSPFNKPPLRECEPAVNNRTVDGLPPTALLNCAPPSGSPRNHTFVPDTPQPAPFAETNLHVDHRRSYMDRPLDGSEIFTPTQWLSEPATAAGFPVLGLAFRPTEPFGKPALRCGSLSTPRQVNR
jgi:hypothetical protein